MLEIDHREEEVEIDPKTNKPINKRPKIEAKKKRKEILDLCISNPKGHKNTYSLLESDDDYKQMRRNYSQEFFDKWKVGFQHYINGDWDSAAKVFSETKVAFNLPRPCCQTKKMVLLTLF